MQNPGSHPSEIQSLSSNPRVPQQWQPIRVRQIHNPVGEGNYHAADEHTIWMSLATRPVRLLHAQGGQTQTALYGKGDILITPANTPLFARWDSDDCVLQIRLKTQFLQNIATETLACDRIELFPAFHIRSPQLESLALMLLPELQPEPVGNHTGSQLYLDSLANVLAVNLLRQHAITRSQVLTYEGGLPPRQLQQVLDYIDAHLDRDLRLADLAVLLDMSQFHFSRLFKQSLSVSPHQYLIQQRLERAKQLLKQTDQSILEIALDCGFNSHSHLSRQFRQVTGMTPKAFRAS